MFFGLGICKNVYALKAAVCDYGAEGHTHTHTKMFCS